ncbi:DUF6602 domain-containing protein [Sorangium sp. So ce1151]|uniref:DUF6602 domain-containing protein n=1 Tax=Sorangium sp. So ce1151 TaxID=3133332 RepID=UPI003F648F6C
MHPRLTKFFSGAVTELRGAYEKSEGSPSPCMGSLREEGVRRAIEHCLPGVARLCEGEIIDPYGGQSGQIDGIVVHSTGSALATSPSGSRIALAEGVLGVIESKSNLTAQWNEVVHTWKAVRTLRRYRDGDNQGTWTLGSPHPSDAAIPLIAIGRTGWKKPDTLMEKALELFQSHGTSEAPPPVLVIQLEPAGLGGVFWKDNNHYEPQGIIYDEDSRGRTLSTLWWMLTSRAQAMMMTPIKWTHYLAP